MFCLCSEVMADPLTGTSDSVFPVTAEDLKFGETQVDQMLDDRPEMAAYVQKDDSIWTWAVRQFAGESLGSRIEWTDYPQLLGTSSVTQDYFSLYTPPTAARYGTITVNATKQGQRIQGEQMWAKVVFELFNIRNSPHALKLERAAYFRRLYKKQFVTDITMLEYGALKESVAFYKNVWQPECEKKGIKTTDLYWDSPVPSTYSEWIEQFTDQSSWPWSVYNKMYDRIATQWRGSDAFWQKCPY